MPGSHMHYIYNPDRPLTEDEELVRKEFPYVSTTVLTGRGRLNQHLHHSDNVHLITKGSISISAARDGQAWLRSKSKRGDCISVDRGVNHVGEPGPEGCIFVEGHKDLSPNTADRFRGRGTIVPVTEGTPEGFTTMLPSSAPPACKYAYNPDRPRTAAEESIRALGYRFVNTVTITPYVPGVSMPDNGIIPERWHHTRSTHKVIAGELLVTNTRTNHLEFPPMRVKPNHERIEIPADNSCIFEAGPGGCTFVEGYSILSPRTAERFADAGTFIRVPEDDSEGFAAEIGSDAITIARVTRLVEYDR
ncbi:hypothetical protein Tdes44962_MAKER08856 [Teratosphaeria destructans]|uniref:Uncharacterized protein n=1 Tax=Teratosphaeria destructans TaxID=418781 RepID=A0A9W7W454_9PEZI|nr:hypothetical protein Tdes44962_MAKER08856 [Teratosphaeria destructans]